MIKLKVGMNNGLCGCDREDILEMDFTQEEWDAMSTEDQEKEKSEWLSDWMWNYLDVWSEVI